MEEDTSCKQGKASATGCLNPWGPSSSWTGARAQACEKVAPRTFGFGCAVKGLEPIGLRVATHLLEVQFHDDLFVQLYDLVVEGLVELFQGVDGLEVK